MEHEGEELKKQQERALKLYGATGALIIHDYLERRQEIVGVNRHDLEDLLAFDGLELAFMGIGGFFLSGAVWLGAEKLLDQEVFQWTPLLLLCALSAIFGSMFLIAGSVMRWCKRRSNAFLMRQSLLVQSSYFGAWHVHRMAPYRFPTLTSGIM